MKISGERDILDSPCIGICSTVYGDNICRGCNRTSEEVIHWNTFTDQQKISINTRLASKKRQL